MRRSWTIALVACVVAMGSWAAWAKERPTAIEDEKVAALTEKIAALDEKIADEREHYGRDVAPLAKGSPEARIAEQKHTETMESLRAEKYKLWRQRELIKAPPTSEELKAHLRTVDDAIETELDHYKTAVTKVRRGSDEAEDLEASHNAKMKVLRAHKASLEDQLADIQRHEKHDAKMLTDKIASIDQELADEDQRSTARIVEININKHRIGQALDALRGANNDQAAMLRHRMGEQDSALVDEKQLHQARVNDLYARKARLANELDEVGGHRRSL